MATCRQILTWALASQCLLNGGFAQVVVVDSFNQNGQLTAEGFPPGSAAVVEWAASPNGPWLDSWTSLGAVPANGGSIQVSVPMFYRVRVLPVPEGMVLIPGGTFTMGDSFGEGLFREIPTHKVLVSSFFMDRCEVTNEQMGEVLQWALNHGKIAASATSAWNTEGSQRDLIYLDSPFCQITYAGGAFSVNVGKGLYPCVAVTWFGAAAYCGYRSEMEGLTGCYDLSNWSCEWSEIGYRLPTEAEWERAARGGFKDRRFPWGDTIQHSQANYYSTDGYDYDVSRTRGYHPLYSTGSEPYTSPVSSFDANPYGLYDMVGNVHEWCWDYNSGDYYEISPTTNPHGPATGAYRVLRGGCWDDIPTDPATYCRIAWRGQQLAHLPTHEGTVGFRAVRPIGQ